MRIDAEFSKRLREARLESGLTQSELAEAVAVSKGAMSMYENPPVGKKTNPLLRTAAAIARTLGVSLDWLCGLQNRRDSHASIFDAIAEVIKNSPSGMSIETKEGGFASIHFSDRRIYNFLSSVKIMWELYCSEQITGQMFDEWMRGALDRQVSECGEVSGHAD